MSHSEKRGQSSETRETVSNAAEMGFIIRLEGAELAWAAGYEALKALRESQNTEPSSLPLPPPLNTSLERRSPANLTQQGKPGGDAHSLDSQPGSQPSLCPALYSLLPGARLSAATPSKEITSLLITRARFWFLWLRTDFFRSGTSQEWHPSVGILRWLPPTSQRNALECAQVRQISGLVL